MKYIALLRGINISGKSKIDMKELKKEDLQITELIHHFVREHVEAGDICIDAKERKISGCFI